LTVSSPERLDRAQDLFEAGEIRRAIEILRRELTKAQRAGDEEGVDAVVDLAAEMRELTDAGTRRDFDRLIALAHGEDVGFTKVDSSMVSGTSSEPCLTCGRSWGGGPVCQFCKQVGGMAAGVRLSSAGKRLGGHLLDVALLLVTLFVGWLVWSLIVYARAQTPAKQLLGMRVITVGSGVRAGWGRMFVREWVAKTILGFVSALLLYVPYFWLLWDARNQELWDKMMDTIVVDDPSNLT
jgi:hypothetical protein